MDDIMDQLLAENIFHCTQCKNLLRIPIMLVENKGNMCYSCYKEYRDCNNVIALENTALVNILKKIKIPCEYKSQGCDQKLQYEDFYKHKDQCMHQTVGCNIASDCPWTGSLNELVTHWEQNHEDLILTSTDDCYELFEIQEIGEGFRILKTSHGTFILNMMMSMSRLQILVYDSDQCENICQHSVIIKFVTDGGDEYKKKCVATTNFKSFILLSGNLVNNIDLNHIEFLGEDIKVVVIIGGFMHHSMIVQKMQEILVCAKCGMYMKSNAYTCGEGHNLCGSCHKQWMCPLCLTILIETNVLENLALLTRFPCRYKNAGCMMKIAANSNHEDTCDFRTWSCFVEGCSSRFRYPDLILHAVNDHQIPNGFANLSNISLHKNVREKRLFHVIEHNQVFELLHENRPAISNNFRIGFTNSNVDNFKWSVNVIRGDHPLLYTYDVEIDFGKTHTVPIKGITLRGSCKSKRDIDFGTKSTSDPVILSGETLSLLCDYTTLQFKVRVFKKT